MNPIMTWAMVFLFTQAGRALGAQSWAELAILLAGATIVCVFRDRAIRAEK